MNGTSRHQLPSSSGALDAGGVQAGAAHRDHVGGRSSVIAPSLQTSSAICSRSCASGRRDALHHHVDGVADRDRRSLADHERGVEGGDLGRERPARALAARGDLDRSRLARELLEPFDARPSTPRARRPPRSTSSSVTEVRSSSSTGRRLELVEPRSADEAAVVGQIVRERREQASGGEGARDARDDQVVARARRGDVEQPQPLGLDVLPSPAPTPRRSPGS